MINIEYWMNSFWTASALALATAIFGLILGIMVEFINYLDYKRRKKNNGK